MANLSDITGQMSIRQGLALLNDARKQASMSYAEHAKCDEIYTKIDEVMAASEAAKAAEAQAANESIPKGENA